MRIFASLIFSWLLAGCTHLFMYPNRIDYSIEWVERDKYVSDLFFKTEDGKELHGWYMHNPENQKPQALIAQVHGNAQNLTSHYQSVIWLIDENLDAFTFDYRGYGMSEGDKDIFAAVSDVKTALDQAAEIAKEKNLPLIAYGQSLGGSLLLKTLEDYPDRWPLKLVIIESSFYSYRQIAREKMASTWLTWPFQWLAYLLVSDELEFKNQLSHLPRVPMLLIYSQRDPVVPIHHGLSIFAELPKGKDFWTYPEMGHVSYYLLPTNGARKKLADYMKRKL